jgi:hypothetical protein
MSRSIDREPRGEPITDRQQATTHCIAANRPLAAFSVQGVAWSATMMPTGRCLDRNRRTQSWHQCRRIRIVRHSGSHRDVIRLPGTGNGSCALDVDRTDFGASVDRRASISVSRLQASVGRLALCGCVLVGEALYCLLNLLVGKDLHGHSNFQ